MRFTSTALLLALPVLGAFAQLVQPQANLARSGGEFAVRQLLSPVPTLLQRQNAPSSTSTPAAPGQPNNSQCTASVSGPELRVAQTPY